jgi:hypothetical protein
VRRSEYVTLLEKDRPVAIKWLAETTFDTYDLEDLAKLWKDFHAGEITLQSYSGWSDAAILTHADLYASWDEEEVKADAADED